MIANKTAAIVRAVAALANLAAKAQAAQKRTAIELWKANKFGELRKLTEPAPGGGFVRLDALDERDGPWLRQWVADASLDDLKAALPAEDASAFLTKVVVALQRIDPARRGLPAQCVDRLLKSAR